MSMNQDFYGGWAHLPKFPTHKQGCCKGGANEAHASVAAVKGCSQCLQLLKAATVRLPFVTPVLPMHS